MSNKFGYLDVNWEGIEKDVKKLAEYSKFLRLNRNGEIEKLAAINRLLDAFRPIVLEVLNRIEEFKVYERPASELLNEHLINILIVSFANNTVLTAEIIQKELEDHIANYERHHNHGLSKIANSSSFRNLTVEDWRLIHLENGLEEFDAIEGLKIAIAQFQSLSREDEIALAIDIEAGVFAEEVIANSQRDIDAFSLIKISNIGRDSFERLFHSQISLILELAVHYRGRGLTIMELIQEGSLGLTRALHKFDHKKGFRLNTYASWWIRQAMTRAIADASSLIRIPVHRFEEIIRIRLLLKDYDEEDLSKIDVQDIEYLCGILEISEKELKVILDSIYEIRSINGYLDPNGELKVRAFGLPGFSLDSNDPSEIIEKEIFEEEIWSVLNTITDREGFVIKSHFGLLGEPLTLQEISVFFGLTRERIRQIESKAISKLRHPSRSEVLKDYLETEIWPVGYLLNSQI